MSRSFHRSSSTLSAALMLGLLLVTASAASAETDAWTSGVEAFRAGDFNTAAVHMADVVAEKPNWYGGYLMHGQIQLQLERPKKAVIWLTKARQLAPEDLSVRLALGQAATTAKDYPLAVSTLAGARPDGLDDTRWLTWLRMRGEAAIGTNDYRAALQDFEAILAKNDDADLRWRASTLARTISDTTAEVDHLRSGERIARANAKRIAAGERINGADGKRMTEADAEWAANRFLGRRLTLALAKSRNLDGDAKTAACTPFASDARRLAEESSDSAHLLIAGRLLDCGGQDDATAVLTLASRAAPEDADVAYHLGRHHALSEGFTQAEAVLAPFAEYPDLDPKLRTRILDWLGYSIERQQRFDEALTVYRRGNLSERIAAAEEAKAIHLANLEAEKKAAAAEALINQINDIEGELEQGGFR